MEEIEKLFVRNVKKEEDNILLVIEKSDGKETVKLTDELSVSKLRMATSAVIQSIPKTSTDSQTTLLQILNHIYIHYQPSRIRVNAFLTTVAESNFYEFCEEVLVESFNNNNRSTSEGKKIVTRLVFSLCHNVSDTSSTFVQNIWNTKIIEIVKSNICNQEYVSKRSDDSISDLISTSVGILHNVTRHIDSAQREILSTKLLKSNLSKYSEWPDEISLACLFTLSMIIDSDETHLLDNQTAVVNTALKLAQGAWESNLRRQNGYHLDELLSGLYYTLRSDKMKMHITNKEYVEFFFEILRMMDRPSEVQAVLIIFKQLSRFSSTRKKLKQEFDTENVLKDALIKSFPYIKSTIQDLIQVYSN